MTSGISSEGAILQSDGSPSRTAYTLRRRVTPYDVAPTLANVLGVRPPSGAIGNPLTEIVRN